MEAKTIFLQKADSPTNDFKAEDLENTNQIGGERLGGPWSRALQSRTVGLSCRPRIEKLPRMRPGDTRTKPSGSYVPAVFSLPRELLVWSEYLLVSQIF